MRRSVCADMILLLALLVVFSSSVNSYIEPPLESIIPYFKASNVQSVVLLICSSQEDKFRTTKALNLAGFAVGYTLDQAISGHQRLGALLDISCPFNYSDKHRWFVGQLVEWLVYGGTVEESLNVLPALPDSSVTVLFEDQLLDVYRPSLTAPIKTANYTPGSTRYHEDFDGVELTAVGLGKNRTNEDGDVDLIFGGLECLDNPKSGWVPEMSLGLVQTLAQQLNFRLKTVSPPDPTCSGLDDSLRKGDVVMSETALMMTRNRLDFLEFTTPLFRVKNRIIYKQPGLSTMMNIYVLPFERKVWYSCLGIVLLSGLVLCVSLKAGGAFNEPYVKPSEILTLIVGFVCQQGTHLNPRSLSVRTTIVIFSLSSLFLYTSYSANIVALLQSSSPTITTLTDLASSPFQLLLHDTLYNRILFQLNKDMEVHELVEKKKVKEKSYVSAQKGILEVRKGLTAFSVETSAGYHLISETFEEPEKCSLSELHVFSAPALGVPLVKDSGYREQFTKMLALQVECGLVFRAIRSHILDKPQCASVDGGYVSVGLTDFKPVLLVLIYGFGASAAAILLEVVTAQYKKRKEVRFNALIS